MTEEELKAIEDAIPYSGACKVKEDVRALIAEVRRREIQVVPCPSCGAVIHCPTGGRTYKELI
jgi:hypothetical protein